MPLLAAKFLNWTRTLLARHHKGPRPRRSSTRQIPLVQQPTKAMGWFDSWFGGESTGADPLAKLDPKLRDYLRRESPIKYTTEDEQQQQDNTPEQAPPKQPPQEPDAATTEKPLVPPQSLFPDGRYAHLWKTYRPLAEIEAETKTDHEKLMDVLDAYKGRKAQIGRAALENCADEQMDWAACMKGGEWSDRMTMCRRQVQRFERCYMTQSVCFPGDVCGGLGGC